MGIAEIIILIVVLVALAYAYTHMPKPQNASPQSVEAPAPIDGKTIRKVWGTVWIREPVEIGWKPMGTDPIKGKGGK